MILCIGEILADMIGERVNDHINFKTFCGGAPLNVAINAKQSGASAKFVGRVGNDSIGRFLIDFCEKVGFDKNNIQIDEERNTTLAFVTLNEGERDFTFFRHETADFCIDTKKIDLASYENLNIVHLGSLMLSEEKGQQVAKAIVKKTKDAGKILSFDVNFRLDLYDGLEQAKKAYKEFVDSADILKFSDDEIISYTGKDNLDDAIKALYRKNRLLLITLGSKGSMFVYNDVSKLVPTEKIIPVDTTGAGDAFLGGVLAELDGKELTEINIVNALIKGNDLGRKTTQFLGAVKI